MWHPLGRKALDVFNRVMGGIFEERADEVKAFVVRDVCRGLLAPDLAVSILCIRVSRRIVIRAPEQVEGTEHERCTS